MSKKFLMYEMTSPEFADAIKETGIVIVPLGSTEQFGPYLPLGSDTMPCFEILKRVASRINEEFRVIVAPPLNYGLSQEHQDFPGTLSFEDPGHYISFVRGICKQLVSHGARKIVLWNCHGGNIGALTTATRFARIDTGAFVVLTGGRGVIKDHEVGVYQIHGGNPSIMLYLFPELVQMDKAKKSLPEKFMKLKYMYNLHTLTTPYIGWMTKDASKSGIIGDATTGSREEGEKFVERAIESTCEFLRELRAIDIDELREQK